MSDKTVDVKMSYDQNNLYASLTGELDHHATKALREEIDHQMCLLRPKALVLNMKQVGFMDSSGIGFLVGRVKLAEKWHGIVRVVDVPLNLLKIFALAGLERLSGLKIESA